MKPSTAPTGLLGKLVATLLASLLLVAGFMFSLVVLAAAAVVGAVSLTYLWWKTRALRRAIRERMAASELDQSRVIEGQARVVREPTEGLRPVRGDPAG